MSVAGVNAIHHFFSLSISSFYFIVALLIFDRDDFFGLAFDPNSILTPFIRNELGAGSLLEIAFHSPRHLSMDQYSLADQELQLAQLQYNLYGPNCMFFIYVFYICFLYSFF